MLVQSTDKFLGCLILSNKFKVFLCSCVQLRDKTCNGRHYSDSNGEHCIIFDTQFHGVWGSVGWLSSATVSTSNHRRCRCKDRMAHGKSQRTRIREQEVKDQTVCHGDSNAQHTDNFAESFGRKATRSVMFCLYEGHLESNAHSSV